MLCDCQWDPCVWFLYLRFWYHLHVIEILKELPFKYPFLWKINTWNTSPKKTGNTLLLLATNEPFPDFLIVPCGPLQERERPWRCKTSWRERETGKERRRERDGARERGRRSERESLEAQDKLRRRRVLLWFRMDCSKEKPFPGGISTWNTQWCCSSPMDVLRSVLQRVAVCCSVLQCVAVCCSEWRCTKH